MKIYNYLLLAILFTVACKGQPESKLKCDANEIIIYTKPACSYCNELKDTLKASNRNFIEHNLTDKQELYEKLKVDTGVITVPYVFINGKYIGGFTDFKKLCLGN